MEEDLSLCFFLATSAHPRIFIFGCRLVSVVQNEGPAHVRMKPQLFLSNFDLYLPGLTYSRANLQTRK